MACDCRVSAKLPFWSRTSSGSREVGGAPSWMAERWSSAAIRAPYCPRRTSSGPGVSVPRGVTGAGSDTPMKTYTDNDGFRARLVYGRRGRRHEARWRRAVPAGAINWRDDVSEMSCRLRDPSTSAQSWNLMRRCPATRVLSQLHQFPWRWPGSSRRTSFADRSSRKPTKLGCRMLPSRVHSLKRTSPTSSGLTQ